MSNIDMKGESQISNDKLPYFSSTFIDRNYYSENENPELKIHLKKEGHSLPITQIEKRNHIKDTNVIKYIDDNSTNNINSRFIESDTVDTNLRPSIVHTESLVERNSVHQNMLTRSMNSNDLNSTKMKHNRNPRAFEGIFTEKMRIQRVNYSRMLFNEFLSLQKKNKEHKQEPIPFDKSYIGKDLIVTPSLNAYMVNIGESREIPESELEVFTKRLSLASIISGQVLGYVEPIKDTIFIKPRNLITEVKDPERIYTKIPINRKKGNKVHKDSFFIKKRNSIRRRINNIFVESSSSSSSSSSSLSSEIVIHHKKKVNRRKISQKSAQSTQSTSSEFSQKFSRVIRQIGHRRKKKHRPSPAKDITPSHTQYSIPSSTQSTVPSPTQSTAPSPTQCTAPSPTQCTAPSPTRGPAPYPTYYSGPYKNLNDSDKAQDFTKKTLDQKAIADIHYYDSDEQLLNEEFTHTRSINSIANNHNNNKGINNINNLNNDEIRSHSSRSNTKSIKGPDKKIINDIAQKLLCVSKHLNSYANHNQFQDDISFANYVNILVKAEEKEIFIQKSNVSQERIRTTHSSSLDFEKSIKSDRDDLNYEIANSLREQGDIINHSCPDGIVPDNISYYGTFINYFINYIPLQFENLSMGRLFDIMGIVVTSANTLRQQEIVKKWCADFVANFILSQTNINEKYASELAKTDDELD